MAAVGVWLGAVVPGRAQELLAPTWDNPADAVVPSGEYRLALLPSATVVNGPVFEHPQPLQLSPATGNGGEFSGGSFVTAEGTAEAALEAGQAPFASEAAPVEPASAGFAWLGVGGENGTNPAVHLRRIVVNEKYTELKHVGTLNTVVFQYQDALWGGQGGFLFEAPYSVFDPAWNDDPVGGFGDLRFQFNYNIYTEPDQQGVLVAYLDMYVPSADDQLLSSLTGSDDLTALDIGTRRFVLGPGIWAVISRWQNFIIADTLSYEFDVAGERREPVSRTRFRLFLMYQWENGLYVMPEVQQLTNFRHHDSDTYLSPEIGYTHNGTTLFVRAESGHDSDGIERQWAIEGGIRWNF